MKPLLSSGLRAPALALVATAAAVVLPAPAAAHSLTGRYESPLPLWAYLAGAAIAVALSFAIVLVRGGGHAPVEIGGVGRGGAVAGDPGPDVRIRVVPGWLRLGLRALGLLAWAWIMAQGIVGSTNSDTDVASLFLWTYGWVVLPLLCALIGPVWDLLDPFATLHDVGAAALRRFDVRPWQSVEYPAALGSWPAVVGFAVFVWLELVLQVARGGRPLATIVFAYTLFTLVMMAQFGRDTWRNRGETFTAWFHLLGRLAPFAWVDGQEGRQVRRRRFASGLLEQRWTTGELALVGVATAAILYDGLSQTQVWFDLFGLPGLGMATLQLVVFLALIAALAIAVARVVGTSAMAAGLVPIALGYLVAHYVTSVLLDSQRILSVLSDPLQLGWNLFGTSTFEPDDSWLPGAVVWAIQLVAVVGGHVLGAWYGHRAAVTTIAPAVGTRARTAAKRARGGARRAAGTGTRPAGAPRGASPTLTDAALRETRLRQVPLAVLMVFLTALTLWSLGQNLVHHVGGGILG